MARWTYSPAGLRLRLPGLLTVASPLLLAGVLPVPSEVSARWGWSGSWLYPVGDPYVMPSASGDGSTEYRAVRGTSVPNGTRRGHEGVDLSNGRGGGPVRTVGNGLVVKVSGKGWNRGYGRHVVIAHRIADGALVYTLYAHLAPGSVTVHRGEFVGAGRVIGKVGMTGRASSPHLHFEVRAPADPLARWEDATVLDPLAYVAGRLPAPRADTVWSRPYLEWAECAALIPPGADGERRPSRAEWWRVLLLATRHPLVAVPASSDSLHATLRALGLLPDDARGGADGPLSWAELARDVSHVRTVGWRLPWSPVSAQARGMDCRRELRTAAPSRESEWFRSDDNGGPTLAEMCLVLADLAGEPPSKPGRAKRRPPAPAPRS